MDQEPGGKDGGMKCTDCDGLGFYDGVGDVCETCKGRDTLPPMRISGNGDWML